MSEYPKLWLLNTNERAYKFWTVKLFDAARKRHWPVEFFRDPKVVTDGIVFCRLSQWEPAITKDRAVMLDIINRCIRTIPDAQQIILYEDKVGQAEAFKDLLPLTFVIRNRAEVGGILERLEFPFISKSAHGSASKNVRLIKDREQALKEADEAFDKGLNTHRGRQKGYLYWQEFCRGNKYDYRCHIVGRERAIARRWNRPDVPFASGSCKIDNIAPVGKEAEEVLALTDRLAERHGTTFACIDIVKGNDGRWKLLETSVAWGGIINSPSWYSRKFVSGKPCANMWNIILDEIEAGSFDATGNGSAA